MTMVIVRLLGTSWPRKEELRWTHLLPGRAMPRRAFTCEESVPRSKSWKIFRCPTTIYKKFWSHYSN